MKDFLRSKYGLLITALTITVFAALTAWAVMVGFEAREAKQTQQRIKRDVKNSINEATRNIKLCPLSDPDCNKR